MPDNAQGVLSYAQREHFSKPWASSSAEHAINR